VVVDRQRLTDDLLLIGQRRADPRADGAVQHRGGQRVGHPRRDARPAEHDDAVTLSEAFHAGGMNRVLGVEHCVDVSTASPTDTTSKSYA
jgi:hypothetical protein